MKTIDRILVQSDAGQSPAAANSESDTRYRGLLELSSEPIVLHTGGRFALVNEPAAVLFGANGLGALIGKPVDHFIRRVGASLSPAVAGQKSAAFTARAVRLDGVGFEVRITEFACGLCGEPAIQAVINELPAAEGAPRAQGPLRFDALTGLPNRTQFRDRLFAALARGLRQKKRVGMLAVNLDRFKEVDRTRGAPAADVVLQRMAERLKQFARREDTVARIGGDEFAMIVEDLADDDGAVAAARRIVECIAQPLTMEADEADLVITASIGCRVASGVDDDADTLLRDSDIAMRCAKDRGGNTYEVYTAELAARKDREALQRDRQESLLALLTPREREVLNLLASGKPNKTVASLLGTSTRTVENQRASIMEKMQVKSLAELVRVVLDRRRA